MEEKMKVLVEKAQTCMGSDADFLMVFHKDGVGATSLAGNEHRIAEVLFTLMHTQDDETGKSVYAIIKQIVLNMMDNGTDLAKDLLRSIDNLSTLYYEDV